MKHGLLRTLSAFLVLSISSQSVAFARQQSEVCTDEYRREREALMRANKRLELINPILLSSTIVALSLYKVYQRVRASKDVQALMKDQALIDDMKAIQQTYSRAGFFARDRAAISSIAKEGGLPASMPSSAPTNVRQTAVRAVMNMNFDDVADFKRGLQQLTTLSQLTEVEMQALVSEARAVESAAAQRMATRVAGKRIGTLATGGAVLSGGLMLTSAIVLSMMVGVGGSQPEFMKTFVAAPPALAALSEKQFCEELTAHPVVLDSLKMYNRGKHPFIAQFKHAHRQQFTRNYYQKRKKQEAIAMEEEKARVLATAVSDRNHVKPIIAETTGVQIEKAATSLVSEHEIDPSDYYDLSSISKAGSLD